MKFLILLLCVYINAEPLYFKPRLNEISCPDAKSTCPTNYTCCPMPTGDYGCCNSPKAVCCSDKKHCCQEGLVCDLKSGSCTNATNLQDSLVIPLISKIKEAYCSDKSICQDGQTYCIMSTGNYLCCPLEKAVCCDDHMHCCPTGTTCDVPNKTCWHGQMPIPWMKKLSSKARVSDVVCPDETEHCDDGQTCCLLDSGNYGCCPFPEAVCCSDKEHCCPTDTICDLTTQTCHQQTPVTMYLFSMKKRETVTCPDQTTCDNGMTCCQLDSGTYACCPLPNAVCCSDHIHCCPNGMTCDVEHKACQSNSGTIQWAVKVPAKQSLQHRVNKKKICPGETWMCDVNATCCHISGDEWSCCYMPEAVCCEDGVHCCKHGQQCDAVHMRCVGSRVLEQKPSTSVKKLNAIQCDATRYCDNGQTCCPDGPDFSCCPFSQATCCDANTCCFHICFFFHMCLPSAKPAQTSSAHEMNMCPDGVHFCENGFECDSTSNTCLKNTPNFEYWAATVTKTSPVVDVTDPRKCPNSDLGCFVGQKCCENKYRGQGCCPFQNGVCCESGYECCPAGTSCSHDGRCRNTGGSISVSPTTLYRSVTKMSTDLSTLVGGAEDRSSNDQCADKSFCPADTTCCLQMDQQFGCCQYSSAVCCEDKIHCCPGGYVCDVARHQCKEPGEDTAAASTLPWQLFTRNKAKWLP